MSNLKVALLSSTSPNSQGETIRTLSHLCMSAAHMPRFSEVEAEEIRELVHDKYNEPLDHITVFEWTQWNTFVAILNGNWTIRLRGKNRAKGLEQYTLLVMRNGLESLPEPSYPLNISYTATLKDSGPGGWVPAAVAWIKHNIYEVFAPSGSLDFGTVGRGGPRWKDGFQGFSYKRWTLWKEILREIGEVGCVESMDEIEEPTGFMIFD